MVRRDAAQVGVARLRTDTAEEDADLGLPPLEVGPQHRNLVVVRQLHRGERLAAPAQLELAGTGDAQVAHPLGVTARRDEVALAVVGQQVDRSRARYAAGAPAHDEHPRPPHGDPGAGQDGDGTVEDVAREPPRLHVTRVAHARSLAPSSGKEARVNDNDPQALRTAMKKVAVALKEADVPFALAGGYAAFARGGPESDHDVAFYLRKDAISAAEKALWAEGLRLEHPPEDWLVKVYDGDAMVDLIHTPTDLPVTTDMLDRADEIEADAVAMPVLAAKIGRAACRERAMGWGVGAG